MLSDAANRYIRKSLSTLDAFQMEGNSPGPRRIRQLRFNIRPKRCMKGTDEEKEKKKSGQPG